MSSYFDGMLRYFEFWGRSTRMQYWMFFLIQFLLTCAGIAIDFQINGRLGTHWRQMPVTLFMVIIHLIPGIMVQVRRLHDIGKPGGWYLLTFLPLGSLVLLYWACLASDVPDNRYGTHEQPSSAPRGSTIPAGVRFGSGRPSGGGGPAPVEGRFI